MINLEHPYFNQTKEWSEFWKAANPESPHTAFFFENESLACYVYQYPLINSKTGLKFWYIPRAFILKNSIDSVDFEVKLSNFLDLIKAEAVKKGVIFIKLDCEKVFADSLQSRPEFILSNKKLQYLETSVLSLGGLVFSPKINEFWQNNKAWFDKNFDKRTRYGTRKALEFGWKVSSEHNPQNFEAFYQLHSATGSRQRFGLHSRNYLEKFYRQDFSEIIILQSSDGIAQAAWLGAKFGDSLINLYGGNSLISRDNYGQYLLHLVALHRAIEQGLKHYDLGGLESGKGFDLFKQGYKGEKREFGGPFDIILKPNLYKIYRFLQNLKK